MSNVTILDLDAVLPEREVVVKLDGNEHKLVPITLEDYLTNSKLIRDLAKGEKALEDEFDVVLDMVNRAFPSIGPGRLRKLTLPQLNNLADFARGADGTQIAQTSEAKEAEANPQ